ncbi:MAG: ISKra4 family transposase [Chloroflexi bacterium]|nr:MAG: ISKra4 family transposase [Chloroflexota bacterium]
MKIKVQVMIEHEDETVETIVEEIGCLERRSASLESLGLSLTEGKEILANLQTKLVHEQIDEYVRQFESCEHCGCKRRRNGRQTITYRTLFGKLRVSGQRFYHCGCQTQDARSFSPIADLVSERTAPEFRFLQTKWASLMSYGLTVKLLEEVLPLSANVATVMRATHQTAQKMEDEQYMYIEGPSRNWEKLPLPDERLFVGIDGGFIRSREKNKAKGNWFEVIVGKSLLKHQSSKRFAFVQTYDEKPKRRLFETLRSHGMQMNQDVTFLSDGGDDVRELQYFLNPNAEHILDWFHVTMRISVMRQIAKGIADEPI